MAASIGFWCSSGYAVLGDVGLSLFQRICTAIKKAGNGGTLVCCRRVFCFA
jgi:hypothetical protein